MVNTHAITPLTDEDETIPNVDYNRQLGTYWGF